MAEPNEANDGELTHATIRALFDDLAEWNNIHPKVYEAALRYLDKQAQSLASARAAGVAEGLERAAAICDNTVAEYRDGKTTLQWTATEAAKRIRALKGTP